MEKVYPQFRQWRALLLAGAVFLALANSAVSDETTSEPNLITAIESVAQKAGPAVVAIRTEQTRRVRQSGSPYGGSFQEDFFNEFFSEFFQQPPAQEYHQAGIGSGVIVNDKGYILTNAHVVGGADRIMVTLADSRSFKATLTGMDTRSDLAVIKIDAPNLPVAVLGDSEDLKIGQWVVAIGNPFGNLLDAQPTVTTGVISALHRALPRTSLRDTDYSDLIQTDAAINPGNSGGPLVNLGGEVIGINVAIFSTSGGYQGIGFAIPVNYAKQIVDQLISGKAVVYGWIGVSIQDIDPRLAKYFNLPSLEGVLLVKVLEGSPADQAGLKDGDIILALDAVKVHSSTTLIKYIGAGKVGKKVQVQILRNNKPMTIEVPIGQRPDFDHIARPADEKSKTESPGPYEWRGLRIQGITPEIADRLNIEGVMGVVVSAVAQNSPAVEAGIRPGDIIVSVNNTPVSSPQEFAEIAGAAKGSCLIRTIRGFFVIEEKTE